MFENRRIRILTNKLYMLGEEHLKLIKDGNYEKAQQKSDEMDILSAKIQELTGKELEKTGKKAALESAKIDKKLDEINQILSEHMASYETTSEEVDSFLEAATRAR